MTRLVAIITARGGSKRVPRKNLRLLAGRPLIAYTIEAAVGCADVMGTFVSTEDAEIAEVAQSLGAWVIERPTELAEDATPSEPVVRHAIAEITATLGEVDNFCLLQPTSPLRNASHVGAAFRHFLENGRRRMISVSPASPHANKLLRMQDGALRPVFDYELFRRPGGSLGDVYLPNGAIYMMQTEEFLQSNDFYSDGMGPFVMSERDGIDIDTEADFQRAERFLAEPAQ